MSIGTTSRDAHLADDELLRFIDREQDEQQAAWQDHVSDCEQCAREVELLRGDASVVHEWLTRAAFEEGEAELEDAAFADHAFDDHHAGVAPDRDEALAASVHDNRVADIEEHRHRQRRRGTHAIAPWLRAAAVLALLATPLAALPSLRQWIVESVTELGGSESAPQAVPAVLSGAPEMAAIRFVPAPGTFRVDFDAAQSEGVLRVERAEGAEAVLRVGGGVEPVVSAASLRLRNGAGTTADYVLQVPASVERVVVQVADGAVVTMDAVRLRAGADVEVRRR
jgi:hypothetical protein